MQESNATPSPKNEGKEFTPGKTDLNITDKIPPKTLFMSHCSSFSNATQSFNLGNFSVSENRMNGYVEGLTRKEAEKIRFAANRNLNTYHIKSFSNFKLLISCLNVSNLADAKALGSEINTAFPHLQTLTMHFNKCFEMTDKTMKLVGIEICRNLLSLKSLSLAFYRCKGISDRGIIALSSEIGNNLKNLKHLDITVTGSEEITDNGLKKAAYRFSNLLNKVESFKFHLKECPKITDNGIKTANSIVVTNSRNLKDLDLDFRVVKGALKDEDIQLIMPSIGLNLKNLQQLVLSFENNALLTDKTLEIVASEIRNNLNQLQRLTLNFSWCHSLTNNSFVNFDLQISTNLQRLKQLELFFTGCMNITDGGLEILGQQMVGYSDLHHLTLVFSKCNKITQKGLEILSESIKSHLKKLNYLRLDFYDCSEISTDHRMKLWESLRSVFPNLYL